MNVARVVQGIVVNIEIADQEWVDEQNSKNPDEQLIPYDEEAAIGYSYDYKKKKFISNK